MRIITEAHQAEVIGSIRKKDFLKDGQLITET